MRFIQFVVGGGIFFSLLISFQGRSQSDWSIKEKEHYALLTDMHLDTGESEEALEWLINNNPILHENIYISGAKLYKEKIETSEHQAQMAIYYDKLMSLYDLRMKHFGRDKDVLARKATDAYLIGKPLASKDEFKLKLFDSLFVELNSSLSVNLLAAYMDITKVAFEAHLIDQSGLMERYFKITEALDDKAEEDVDKEKYHAIVDQLFLSVADLKCDDIKEIFSEDLERANPDISRARLVVKMSVEMGCTGADIFDQALSVIYNHEPNIKVASFLAKKAETHKDLIRAEQLYRDMVSMSETNEQKVESYLEFAKYWQRRGDKPKARIQLRNALKVDPGNKEAFDILGQLYFYSYEQCKEGISRVEDRCVYLLAYDYFQKAGNIEMMKESFAQFPSAESIHQETFSVNEEITCGCWINEKTTIRKRVE